MLGTQTHEGAHAVTALIFRHGVPAIRLERDHSGTTRTMDYGGLGSFLVTFNGYLGPGVIGVAMGFLIGRGYPNGAIAVYACLSILMLVFMRNTLGLIFVAGVALLSTLVIYVGNDRLSLIVALTVCWYMALVGWLGALDQMRVLMYQPDSGTDAEALRELTHLPAKGWAGVHLVCTLILGLLSIALSLGPLA